ncbi:MAG: thioesterase family protein [Pseudomonadota bacterium]
MSNPSFSELLAGMDRGQSARIEADIPAGWMQGRTTYGGLTTALCHESARELAEGAPIRAVQVAFIGPVGGHVVFSPNVLRRGRSAAFINVDVVSERGIMARAIFTFGTSRESTVRVDDLPMPDIAGPDGIEPFMEGMSGGPSFMQHFDMLKVTGGEPFSGSNQRQLGLWLRHRGCDEPDSPTALLALADAPLPPALVMMSTLAPTSSMTWMAEFVGKHPNPDGWYYATSKLEAAADGYSSQRMALWSQDRRPVMIGRQTVAMFS